METTTQEDDILVFDEGKGEHVNMYEVPINPKDRIFLKTLYDSDKPLTTTEIREQTGLERYDIVYRYKKFGEERYTELLSIKHVGKEQSPASTPVEDIKQAELTDEGRKLINQGLIGDPSEEYTPNEVVVTEETLEEYQNEIDRLESRIDTLKNTLDHQKNTVTGINDIESDVNSILEWREKINVFVIAVKSAMDELGVDFGKHLKEAQKEVERREKE